MNRKNNLPRAAIFLFTVTGLIGLVFQRGDPDISFSGYSEWHECYGSYGDDRIFDWKGLNMLSGGPGNDYILAKGEPESDDCAMGHSTKSPEDVVMVTL